MSDNSTVTCALCGKPNLPYMGVHTCQAKPELMAKQIQSLQQQLADCERERDDLKTKIVRMEETSKIENSVIDDVFRCDFEELQEVRDDLYKAVCLLEHVDKYYSTDSSPAIKDFLSTLEKKND